MQQRIAFFDFDGTITTKDTLLEFIKFSKGTIPFYIGFGLNSPWLVAFKLKLIRNQTAKERILTYFFKGMSLGKFDEVCTAFAAEKIPALLRPKALEEIEKLKQEGVPVVVVSASPGNWIRPWAQAMGLELIATCLELNGNKLTGKIEGNNCYGVEKVRRIELQYTLSDYTDIYAYGDSSGDKPMLAVAQRSFYKPFR